MRQGFSPDRWRAEEMGRTIFVFSGAERLTSRANRSSQKTDQLRLRFQLLRSRTVYIIPVESCTAAGWHATRKQLHFGDALSGCVANVPVLLYASRTAGAALVPDSKQNQQNANHGHNSSGAAMTCGHSTRSR